MLKNIKFNKLDFGRMFLSTLFKWRRERFKCAPDINVPPVTSAKCVPHHSFSSFLQDSKGIHKLWCWLKVVLLKLVDRSEWLWVNNFHELSKRASPATVIAGLGSSARGPTFTMLMVSPPPPNWFSLMLNCHGNTAKCVSRAERDINHVIKQAIGRGWLHSRRSNLTKLSA